jgi:hypothetical protein
MKMLIKCLPIAAIMATVFQTAIAQATPASNSDRSGTTARILRPVQDKFGCLPLIPTDQPGFDRYEIANAISNCANRISELTAAGTGSLPSQTDLQTLQVLKTEFAAEIAEHRPRQPLVRPIESWTIPTLKTLGQRYGCPSLGTQMRNPPDLRTERYDIAATIQVCIDRTDKRQVTMQKADAANFQAVQTEFAGELVKLRSGGFCDFP